MKNKTFKMLSLVLAVVMIFSMSTVAFAAEAESTDNVAEFGDILYSDDGVTVFYGNPNENIELAEQVEAQARSLQYDYAWVDANTYTTRYISIPASTANPLTYYTIKQEADSLVNGKIICRKMAKKNVVFPTYFLYHEFMIQYNYVNHRR